jgi:hypothetical protein
VNCRAVGSSAWQAAVSNVAANPSNGAWTSPYTITIPGAVEYQAVFGGLDVFLPSVSSIAAVDTSVGTVVSAPTLPALTHGSGFNISGTIKVNGTGENVVSGLAELWWRYTVGGDQAWKKSSVSQTITAGTYSMTHPALSILGATEWQVRYVGDTKYDPANSAAVAATITLPAHGALTKGAVTHSTAQFSWAAVSGATGYEVQIWGGTGQWLWKADLGSGTLTFTDTGLNLDTQYFWRVRPKAADPAGTVMYGTASAYVSLKTGHPQQTATGTSAWINVPITYDDSWRNDTDDWAQASDMRQGYFTDSTRWYIGAAIYGSAKIRDAVIAATGATNHANGTCSAAEIQMARITAVGDYNNSIATTFYRSTTMGSSPGGKPDLLGTGVARTLSNVAAGTQWYDIGTAHGQALGDGDAASIVIYKTSAASYAAFHAYDLRLKWTWNYVSVAYVAPAWV